MGLNMNLWSAPIAFKSFANNNIQHWRFNITFFRSGEENCYALNFSQHVSSSSTFCSPNPTLDKDNFREIGKHLYTFRFLFFKSAKCQQYLH